MNNKYQEFLEKVVNTEYPRELSMGQKIMVILKLKHPRIYKNLHNSNIDCFCDDSCIIDALGYIQLKLRGTEND